MLFRSGRAPGFAKKSDIIRYISTSGTTGTSKVVGLSTEQIESRMSRFGISLMSEGRSRSSLTLFGFSTAAGFRFALESLWAGGVVCLGFGPDGALDAIQKGKIERLYASAAQYRGLAQYARAKRFDLSSLKYALVSGSVMPKPLIREVRSGICRMLINLYGSTEMGLISFGPLTDTDESGSCGTLVPWIEAEAVDPNGKVVAAGKNGILRFRASDMAAKYENAPESEVFKDGWFYPGDIGSIGQNRLLMVTGRASERINAGGVKVSPERIEEVMAAYDGIKECAAFEAPDSLGMPQIWAAVVAGPKVDLDRKSVV